MGVVRVRDPRPEVCFITTTDPTAATHMGDMTVLPLRTPTLPPATHTNTVLFGRERSWIVDPATPHDAERARLLEALDARAEGGRPAHAIVLTHHHDDHVGAAAWLRAERGLPIYAHPKTRDILGARVPVDEILRDGDVIVGSDAPDDRWEVMHTPGHASGHIVLWQGVRRGLIAGDMVAAIGTIIIVPPDGHMATYVAQLERLAELDPAWLVPAHGQVIDTPVAHLRGYVRHRLAREAQVVQALAQGPAELSTITARSYPDVPASLHPLAEYSCLAHLQKLEEEGLAQYVQGVWSRLEMAG